MRTTIRTTIRVNLSFIDFAYYSVELCTYRRKIPLAMFAVVTYIFPRNEICVHNYNVLVNNRLIEFGAIKPHTILCNYVTNGNTLGCRNLCALIHSLR